MGSGQLMTSQLFVGCQDALTPAHYDLADNVYVQVARWLQLYSGR